MRVREREKRLAMMNSIDDKETREEATEGSNRASERATIREKERANGKRSNGDNSNTNVREHKKAELMNTNGGQKRAHIYTYANII